ncbi:MAG TPA: hypothetical protein PK880_02400 [Candidatus Competibacter sp.]|nr:hypothetical protein [Candidatus Competibacter sp.]
MSENEKVPGEKAATSRGSIYFIGGASASGKSTAARMLAARDGRAVVELDNFYDILGKVVDDQGALEKVTQKIALEVVARLLSADAFCIVEGGWIDPSKARKLKEASDGRFYPVYCGYPRLKVEARFKMIRKKKVHWLAEKSAKAAHSFLQEQIKLSRWYRKECKRYDLPFFDFSTVEDGVAALSVNYTRWWESSA